MDDLTKVFTRANIAVLGLISAHDGLYIREIAEKAKASPAIVHRAIRLFKGMGFLTEKRIKNRRGVFVLRGNALFKKIKSLLNTYALLAHPAFRRLQAYGKVGIYGSFASGEDAAESDIDLWIYPKTKLDFAEAKGVARRIEKSFGKEVRLLILSDEKIKSMRGSDPEFYYRLKLTSVGEDVFG